MSSSRRDFLTRSAAAAALAGAPAAAQRGPNDTLGVACIGVGTRGFYLLNEMQKCPGVELRVISDLYDANLGRAVKASKNPKVKTTKDWTEAATSRDVDVVIIATPDFWHAPMTIRAAEAGKDVYCEKGLCRTLDEAKAVRKAVKSNRRVLQLGHHTNSEPAFIKAREIFESGKLGKVVLARTHYDRTGPYPEWQFYTTFENPIRPADADARTIDWNRFIANASERAFDVERFFRWRCYWEYGTGIAGDLMSHLWDGVNMIMTLGIPASVSTQGGLYFWKEDREVPDQWHTVFDYPKRETMVTFSSTFHSRHLGTGTFLLGREGSLEVGRNHCRLYPAEWKPELAADLDAAKKKAVANGRDADSACLDPIYSFKKGDVAYISHMQDFVNCARSRQTPRCGIHRAWEEAVTIVMSVESYFKERKVKWDPVNEVVL